MTTPFAPRHSWSSMLAGPPSRDNLGSLDLGTHGLLAVPSGSYISIIDSHSTQLISTFQFPPPSPFSTATSYFSTASTNTAFTSASVTSVRWSPVPLRRDLLSTDSSSSHLLLAAGDRQGRIGLFDFRLKSAVLWFDTDSKFGIQDLCWVQARSDSYVLASINGASTISLYNTTTGRHFWRYHGATEFFSRIRRDPFDSRHCCAIGLKGFLLSLTVLGDTEKEEILLKTLQISIESSELQKLEKDLATVRSSSPAAILFSSPIARFAFSPHWNHILFVTFPRELIVFDLQYEAPLITIALPRGCTKFLDIMPHLNNEWLYCIHVDAKLSTWRRKEGAQVYFMCTMEELIPSIGTSVPTPSLLAAVLCQSDFTLENIHKTYYDAHESPSFDDDFDNLFGFSDERNVISKTSLISITDDGRIWNWLLTAEGAVDTGNDDNNVSSVDGVNGELLPGTNNGNRPSSLIGLETQVGRQLANTNGSKTHKSTSGFKQEDITFKIILHGQLQLLSSTVTTLAVPAPSLTATLARGGNYPAVAVPLVALGTQNGTIDVIDASANVVASSFSVHDGMIRGLRWLGNSKLVSFSHTQVNGKFKGYNNRLILTCLRSGHNKMFRALEKPEHAPIRTLRASSSGRYLLILFRDAPVEVWAMSKNPVMLRSLALPFEVMEWSLPAISLSQEQTAEATDSKLSWTESSHNGNSESFAFALANGALGVFEVHGLRIHDFRPKCPSSFVSPDGIGMITALAYCLPHVVMGDKSGNILWWNVTTGSSSLFNINKDGIKYIKFSHVTPGDVTRGHIAILFYDNTFSVYDLDSQNPLANPLLYPQFPGTFVLELDWLAVRTDKNDPLVLCIAGIDSFRLVEVNVHGSKPSFESPGSLAKEIFRPMPLCSPILLPTPYALALRMILQLGVIPSWFDTCSANMQKRPHQIPGNPVGDSHYCTVDLLPVGDSMVPELLLEVLEPYQKEGSTLDEKRAKLYGKIVNKGCSARFAFAAAIFGEFSEALFWLQLPRAINYLMNKLSDKSPRVTPVRELDDTYKLDAIGSRGKPETGSVGRDVISQGQLKLMDFGKEELWEKANERIQWHEKLEGEEAMQNHLHELISIGNLEAAVSLMLSTPPESSNFYLNALRAVALSSSVSRSLHELAVKVVAANMVRNDSWLSGTHLLCAVGRYQEACSQLQDAGCWTDAATLAAAHLKGSDYARVLRRWARYMVQTEHNIWRALILFVAAGALQEAVATLLEAQQPDAAAMFIFACRELHADRSRNSDGDATSTVDDKLPNLPGLDPDNENVIAIVNYYGECQKKLVHLCVDYQHSLT